jgi:hypothetical protein
LSLAVGVAVQVEMPLVLAVVEAVVAVVAY